MNTQPVDDDRLSDMVQILTHRLSSLTAGVQGYADLLTETLESVEQRRLARNIFEGVSRIDGVMADLRLFTRPVNSFPAFLPIDQIISGVLDLISEKDHPRISISSDVPRSTRLFADPVLSRQSVLAILKNALEAAGQQGEIRLHARDCGDGFVEIAVENEGVPIPPEAAPRIFDPFFTTKAQNLGIGLTLARLYARKQGGGIELASATSEATTRLVLSIPTSPANKL